MLNRPWKQLKAEGLFNKWVIFHSEEEFDDLIVIMKEAQIDISDNMNSKTRVTDGHRYVRSYPCFGQISECGVPECGPFVHFEEVDICDAREFVKHFEKATEAKQDEPW